MDDSNFQKSFDGLDRAIELAEAALSECDLHGFVYAAIDLSSALDKLVAIRFQKTGR